MHTYETAKSVVEDVEKFKVALSHVLLKKAIEAEDSNTGAFLYLLSKILSELKVVESHAVEVMGVSGDTLCVGPLYSRLIESTMRKKPEDVVKLKTFLLLHEALHRVFGHDVRITMAGDKALYNILADLYVNTILEHQLGISGLEGFVTLRNLVDFITTHFGTQLSEEQVSAVRLLASYEVENKLSVEQVYNVLVLLPKNVVESVKSKFGAGKFYGKDLMADKEDATEKGEPAGAGERSEGEGGSLEEPRKIKISEAAENGKMLAETLDHVSGELKKAIQRIERAIGEYQALKRLYEGIIQKGDGSAAGTGKGIARYQEYKQMYSLLLPVHHLFMLDVGETLSEPKTTFERFDDEAYWLPAREVERRRAVLALVDASPSVPDEHLNLFLSCIVNTVHTFDLEYRLAVFGTGVLDEKVVTTENINAEITRVPRGQGTVWDETVARCIRDAVMRGIRLIQVLSDFWINVTDEARQAIMEFKSSGGKISCYSSSGDFLYFCDNTYTLPVLPKQ